MGSYKVIIRQSADKELKKIPARDLHHIVPKIKSLSHEPRPIGSQLLKMEGRFYRIRQGDYRVIYQVNDHREEVVVVKIGHRREVYG